MADENLQPIGLQAILDDTEFTAGLTKLLDGYAKADQATEQTAEEMTKAGGVMDTLGNVAGGLGNVLGSVLTTAAAAAAVGIAGLAAGITAASAVFKVGVDSAMEWGEQLGDLGDMFGMSGEEAATWSVAMQHVGLSVSEGSAQLNYFTKQMAGLKEETPKTTTTIKDNSDKIAGLKEQLETANEQLDRAKHRMADAKEPTDSLKWAIDDAQKKVNKLNSELAGTPATVTSFSTTPAKISPFHEALNTLGVKATDSKGKLKDFDTIMPEIMDHFAKMPPGIEATELAMELFGVRGGSKFLDFLRQGSQGLTDAQEKAEAFGLILSTEETDAMEQFGFQMNDLGMAMEGFKVQIGMAVMPILEELAGLIGTEVVPQLTAWAKEHMPELKQALADAFDWLKTTAMPLLQDFAGFITGSVFPALQILGDTLDWFFKMLEGGNTAGAVNTLITNLLMLVGVSDEVSNDLGNMFAWVTEALEGGNIQAAVNTLVTNLLMLAGVSDETSNAMGDAAAGIVKTFEDLWSATQPILTAIYDELAKTWEEIEPKLEKAWENITGAVQDAWGFIMPLVQQAMGFIQDRINENMDDILALWDGIWKEIQGTVEVVWSLIEGIVKIALDLLGGDMEAAGEDWEVMVQGIMDGLQKVFEGGWEIIQMVFATAITTIVDALVAKAQEFADAAAAIGGAIVQGIADAILGAPGAILEALSSVVNDAINAMMGTLGLGGGGDTGGGGGGASGVGDVYAPATVPVADSSVGTSSSSYSSSNTYNYNLTTNSTASASSIQYDFGIMQSLAGA